MFHDHRNQQQPLQAASDRNVASVEGGEDYSWQFWGARKNVSPRIQLRHLSRHNHNIQSGIASSTGRCCTDHKTIACGCGRGSAQITVRGDGKPSRARNLGVSNRTTIGIHRRSSDCLTTVDKTNNRIGLTERGRAKDRWLVYHHYVQGGLPGSTCCRRADHKTIVSSCSRGAAQGSVSSDGQPSRTIHLSINNRIALWINRTAGEGLTIVTIVKPHGGVCLADR